MNFLTLHTPYASLDPALSEALVRRGRPTWNHDDWLALLRTLQHAGFGWLRPEGVERDQECRRNESELAVHNGRRTDKAAEALSIN